MPRYYKQKLYTDEQRVEIGIATLKRMQKQKEKNPDNRSDVQKISEINAATKNYNAKQKLTDGKL